VPASPLRLAADADLRGHAHAWVNADALRELVVAFGGDAPDGQESLSAALAELDAFSMRWDFRKGRERNQLSEQALEDMPTETVERAVQELGQCDVLLPAIREWDHVLVLGGLVRACISRTAFAAGLLQSGSISAREITCLGSFRPLNAAELALAEESVGAVPRDEIDAMQLGAFRAFKFDGPFQVRGEQYASAELSWETRASRDELPWHLQVAAAPAQDAGRRATTAQALAWFGRTRDIDAGTSILLITTEIYRHYHLVDAYRTLGLPYGARVDCVGMRPGDVIPELAHEFTAASRLQEIRSSIRALRALVAQL
jgi:hypothetical protein